MFSGIGGFSLGLERTGMETVAFCENDAFCQKVLAKHWPDAPIYKNIEELDGRQYKGTVDLVCGGFPCQPYSVAGEQRGSEDDRALWPEMLRVIREVEPAWVIGENVPGIINMELDNVLSDLEGEGYSCQTFVIPACSVDARHKRVRVWIIASHTNFNSKPDSSQYEGQRSGQLDVGNAKHNGSSTAEIPRSSSPPSDNDTQGQESSSKFEGASRPRNDENVGHSTSSRQPRQGEHEYPGNQEAHREREASHALNVGFRKERRSQPRMGGMVDGVSRWLDEPEGTPRVMGKVPDRVNRLKALGNAVVPQVVEVLGRMIMEIEAEQSIMKQKENKQ